MNEKEYLIAEESAAHRLHRHDRPSYQVFVVVFAVILLSILGVLLYQWFERPEAEAASAQGQRVTVTSVSDGDIFTATDSGGGGLGRLHVLGIDTP